MTAPDVALTNSLEQILAADLNRIGGLAGKAVMDTQLMLEGGVDATNTPRSCTLRGLNATPDTGMAVMISPGTAVRFDVSITGVDVSQYTLGRVQTETSVSIAAAHPTLPRLDLIYGTVSTLSTDAQTRNILTLPSRVVTPTSVFKSARPLLTLAVVTGSPNTNPDFTVTPLPAGAVPLWYVYVPAAATTLQDDHLIDARIRFVPTPFSRQHGRDDGLYAEGAGTSVVITSGRGKVQGAVFGTSFNYSQSAVSLFQTGAGTLLADTEYHVYMVAKGHPDTPVGKNVQNGVVPVVISTITPTSGGFPSSPLQYRPLFGLGVDNLTKFTLNALYLGTIHTDTTSSFQPGGDGIPLNVDGTARTQNITVNGGVPGSITGWIKKPDIIFNNAGAVTIPTCAPIIAGVPGLFPQNTASMPGNLASGETELASTWYYLYLRTRVAASSITRGAIRHYVPVFSNEAPNSSANKPTPESGFASFDYIYVGSVYNNSSSGFDAFTRCGDIVRWRTDTALFPAGDITGPVLFTPITANVPATSKIVLAPTRAMYQDVSGFQDFTIFNFTTGLNGYNKVIDAFPAPDFNMEWYEELHIHVSPGGGFRARKLITTGTFTLFMLAGGYLENIEQPVNTNP